VSLLLRESLQITSLSEEETSDSSSSAEKLHCVTDHRATVRERVGDMLFEYTAGSFFQNNNSVLVPLTSYVRDAVFSCEPPLDPQPTHLVDAYCGSGLFAITLSPQFKKVAGIELSSESISCATKNAELNNLPKGKCSFMEGDAANIFATVQDFPRDRTVLIIDPPRKGSDEKFIDQLIQFACQTVVYVSCNVHTQARDVGMILRKSEAIEGKKYVLDSVRGFDLFPQTAHVESVAVLRLVDSP
jgi:tRNA (uracil-5-)-methyltransferase